MSFKNNLIKQTKRNIQNKINEEKNRIKNNKAKGKEKAKDYLPILIKNMKLRAKKGESFIEIHSDPFNETTIYFLNYLKKWAEKQNMETKLIENKYLIKGNYKNYYDTLFIKWL